MLHEYIVKTMSHQDLNAKEMSEAMEIIMEGTASPIQVSALLTALEMKGETPTEIASAVKVMINKALPIQSDDEDVLDIVGTGGDGLNTFNISTTCAFVLAGAGVKVAKHGNRGVSSKSGAADVLEAMGIPIDLAPNQVNQCLKEAGIAFLFAQTYHRSMKNVAYIRKEMAVKTLFNILGPLTNPIRPSTYVIGAYDQEAADLMIKVYQEMGVKNAVVFHGDSHMDEVSLTGPTDIQLLRNGQISHFVITPEQFGLKRAPIEAVIGGDCQENAKILIDVLQGKPGPHRDIVLLNSAVALYCANVVNSIEEGIEKAKTSIDTLAAYHRLELLKSFSKEKAYDTH